MPFDGSTYRNNRPERPKRQRVTIFRVTAPQLKAVIVDAAIAGLLTTREAEDLIAWYGLREE